MTSRDMYVVVNDEQQFRLYVIEQFGKMDARMTRIETRLDGLESRVGSLETRVGNIESDLTALAHQQELTAAKLDMGLWIIGICFAALAVLVTFIGIFAPRFWEKASHKESPSSTVINIPQPQIDITAIARQVGEILNLKQAP